MPIYEYKCTECDEHFDIQQSIKDDTLTTLPGPDHEHKLKKIFHPVGIAFKGEGFYKNDARSSSTSTKAPSSSSDSAGGDSSNKSQTSESSANPDTSGSSENSKPAKTKDSSKKSSSASSDKASSSKRKPAKT